MEAVLAWIQPLIEAYSGNLGVAVQIISVLVALRIFIKPLFSLAQAYVDFTVTPTDNVKLQKILDSKAYKTIAYVLDWLASIKLPK
jgi:hypothetical protein